MVVSAALLLRERGIARTRFDDVIEHAGAPRGSIAHHFPEGKRQLVAEAVLWAGAQATRALRAAADGGTSADLVRVIVAVYRRALVDTEFAAGAPSAWSPRRATTTTSSAPRRPRLRRLARGARRDADARRSRRASRAGRSRA
jgi:AcrR family transcriptional regulator